MSGGLSASSEEVRGRPATELDAQAEHAAATWDVLAVQVQAFIQAWEGRPEPPEMAEFVTDGPANLRRLVLLEIIKVDLDYRWSRGRQPRPVEDYLAAFPELALGGPPCDLLYEEYHVRKRAGDPVDPQDYLERFPGQADELGRLLGLEAPHLSTSLFKQQLQAVEAGGAIDDFDLFALLGKGAFARVFLARQRSMQRLVALKVSADSGDEPQTLAQLDHPHIVRVFDQRSYPTATCACCTCSTSPAARSSRCSTCCGGRRRPNGAARRCCGPWTRPSTSAANRRRSGSALRDRLAAWSWPETVCWLGARLAEALDYAHRQGVLHRDVKPANVLLTAEGCAQTGRFQRQFQLQARRRQPGGVLRRQSGLHVAGAAGGLQPRPPATAADLDGRADLYSLCVVLWELLAGRRPFRDDALAGDWGEMLAADDRTTTKGRRPRRDGRPARRPARAGWNRCCSPASTPTRPAARNPAPTWRATWTCACGRGRVTCCTRRPAAGGRSSAASPSPP